MQTVFGGGVALVRCLLSLLAAVAVFVAPETLLRLSHAESDLPQLIADRVFGVVLAVVLVLFGLVELGLGLATLAGRNWARLWLMLSAVVTVVGAFVSNLTGSERITLLGLPATATSILLLLALTSHRAREYAARGRRPGWPRRGGRVRAGRRPCS